MLVLPGLHQAPDRGCRQAGRVRAQQRCERILELARGDALQVSQGSNSSTFLARRR
jgi:hypothetical protein